MDDPGLPPEQLRQAHDGLWRTHRLLRNHAAIIRAIRRDPLPVQRVLDIGCGRGDLLVELRRRLSVHVIGMDLRPPRDASVPIVAGDAVHDPLPDCDVAIAICVVHHLADEDLIALIRNVARAARRFIILDPVRHSLPLLLFRALLAPALPSINAYDGCVSIRRSWTPAELRALVQRALEGTGARFRHRVAPLYTRQIVDIDFNPTPA